MGKRFVKPTIEFVKFDMKDLVVASSCDICDGYDCGKTDGKVCCDGAEGNWQA